MASNFKLFDEAKVNMMGDTEYATATQRLNGVQTGLASSKLNNKFAYQVSLMCYALAQIMQQNGQNALDTDTVSTFVSNLSNSILQKVADKAVYTDPMQGATSSVANRWISAGALRAYIDSTFGGWYDSSGNFIMQVNKGGTGLSHVPVGALMVGNNTGPFNFLEIGASVPGVMVRQPTVSMASPIYYDFHYNSGPGYYCGFTIIQWRPDLNQPIVDWLPISKDTSTEAVPFYNRSNNQLSWIVPPSSGKWSLGFLGNSIAQFAEPMTWNLLLNQTQTKTLGLYSDTSIFTFSIDKSWAQPNLCGLYFRFTTSISGSASVNTLNIRFKMGEISNYENAYFGILAYTNNDTFNYPQNLVTYNYVTLSNTSYLPNTSYRVSKFVGPSNISTPQGHYHVGSIQYTFGRNITLTILGTANIESGSNSFGITMNAVIYGQYGS